MLNSISRQFSWKMVRVLAVISVLALVFVCYAMADEKKKITQLQIGVKKRIDDADCKMRSKKGDTLHMHYTGTLYEDGSKFDSSVDRNQPFVFTLGSGQVIKGWDKGLLNMCEGEKRRLVIPADMGYGARGSPPKIPENAALVFEVELLSIERKSEL